MRLASIVRCVNAVIGGGLRGELELDGVFWGVYVRSSAKPTPELINWAAVAGAAGWSARRSRRPHLPQGAGPLDAENWAARCPWLRRIFRGLAVAVFIGPARA